MERFVTRSDSCAASPWSSPEAALHAYFGYSEFRPPQKQVIQHIFNGKSAIVLMPTGGGKSIIYQLPALMFPEGVTLVVSPLIALMRDQVNALQAKGVQAAVYCSSTSASEKKALKAELSNTKKPPVTRLLYITPETLTQDKFLAEVIMPLYDRSWLNLIAIDEAHCISSWGHDFRPAYRRLAKLPNSLPSVRIVALTATATPPVVRDIAKQLKIDLARRGDGTYSRTGGIHTAENIFIQSFDRSNLSYDVVYSDLMTETQELDHLLKKIETYLGISCTAQQQAAEEKDRLRSALSLSSEQKAPCQPSRKSVKRQRPRGSAIIYCHSKKAVADLAGKLSACGISAAPYHAGMSNNERSRVQEQWSKGAIPVIVATIAFGMGIDKANVRLVVHWSIPKSLEGYYQEAGRAGRDGNRAACVLYFRREDVSLFDFVIRQENERSQNENKKSKLPSRKTDPQEKLQRDLRHLKEIENYAMTVQCRRVTLLKHFGEETENPSPSCQYTPCDVCSDKGAVERKLTELSDLRTNARSFGYGNTTVEESEASDDEEINDQNCFPGFMSAGTLARSSVFQPKKSIFKTAEDVMSHLEALEEEEESMQRKTEHHKVKHRKTHHQSHECSEPQLVEEKVSEEKLRKDSVNCLNDALLRNYRNMSTVDNRFRFNFDQVRSLASYIEGKVRTAARKASLDKEFHTSKEVTEKYKKDIRKRCQLIDKMTERDKLVTDPRTPENG